MMSRNISFPLTQGLYQRFWVTLVATGLVCFIFTLSTPAYGTVYKWKDSNNNIHYSDDKPRGVKDFTVIGAPPPPPSDITNSNEKFEKQIGTAKEKLKLRKQEAQNTAIDNENDAQKRASCKTARENLDSLRNARALSYRNDAGEIVRMDETVKTERIKVALKNIQRFCN